MSRRPPNPQNMARRRAALEAKRQKLRERVRSRLPKKKPRRRGWILLVVLLLLLLIALCCLGSPPEEEPEVPVESGPVEIEPAEPTPPPPVPPAPLTGRIERRDRPDYDGVPPGPPAWLSAFRMQVAARSPRLAKCFDGALRPGQLKWTTSVEPHEGTVSQHTLEPLLATDDLTPTERECVFAVLSAPQYRLQTGEERTTPSRVSLVIEF